MKLFNCFLTLILASLFSWTSMAAEAPKKAIEQIDSNPRPMTQEAGLMKSESTWRFGVGFGVQPQMQNSTVLEIGTGELLQCRNHGLSLILSYAGRETEAKDIKNEHYENSSYRLMAESKLHGSNPYSNIYVRLGVGYTDTDRVFHPDGGFFMMPFEIGMDTLVMKTDWSTLAFFVQGGSEINFLGKNTAARDFDALGITLGFRGYY